MAFKDFIDSFPVASVVGIDTDDDYIYVACFNTTVRIYDKVTYALVHSFGSYGTGDGQFRDGPTDIVVDDTYMYVADGGTYRIQIFLKASPYTFVYKFGSIGSTDYGFGAGGINLHLEDDTLYTTNEGNRRVTIYDKNIPCTFIAKFGTRGVGNGQFEQARGIHTDADYIYVVDYNFTGDGNFQRVQIFDKTTYAFVTKFGTPGSGDGQFNYPEGLYVDDTYIYVADIGNDRVQIFDKITRAFVTKFGTSGSGDGQFSYPRHIDITDGLMYVTDYVGNYRVSIFEGLPAITLGRRKKIAQLRQLRK